MTRKQIRDGFHMTGLKLQIYGYAGVAEWQTHMTQNHAGNHAGSSPATGTHKKSLTYSKDRL